MPIVANEDFTLILARLHDGDAGARQVFFDLVYRELRELAAGQMRSERGDHTLQPTALVHEAYLRLFGNAAPSWENRAHFFGTAAEVMRRILVDHARTRAAAKRGGNVARAELADRPAPASNEPDDLLAIDEALKALEQIDGLRARVVKLRYFSGLSFDEIAAALGTSVRTVKRQWQFARAWLFRRIEGR